MNIQKTNTGWVGLAPVIVLKNIDAPASKNEYILRRKWCPQWWLDVNTKLTAPARKTHGLGHVLKTGTVKKGQ